LHPGGSPDMWRRKSVEGAAVLSGRKKKKKIKTEEKGGKGVLHVPGQGVVVEKGGRLDHSPQRREKSREKEIAEVLFGRGKAVKNSCPCWDEEYTCWAVDFRALQS